MQLSKMKFQLTRTLCDPEEEEEESEKHSTH